MLILHENNIKSFEYVAAVIRSYREYVQNNASCKRWRRTKKLYHITVTIKRKILQRNKEGSDMKIIYKICSWFWRSHHI